MSFNLQLRVDGEGEVTVTTKSGNVPEGDYSISGHLHNSSDGDWQHNSIAITTSFASASGSGVAKGVK